MINKRVVFDILLGGILATLLTVAYMAAMPDSEKIASEMQQAFMEELRYDTVNNKDNNLVKSYNEENDTLSIEFSTRERVNIELQKIENKYYNEANADILFIYYQMLIFVPLVLILLKTTDNNLSIIIIVLAIAYLTFMHPADTIDFVKDEIDIYKYNELLDDIEYANSFKLVIPEHAMEQLSEDEPKYIQLKVHEKLDNTYERTYMLEEFADSLNKYVYTPIN